MVEPAKPFACTLPDCGMTFTNEDHLHVHTKKHDMVLSLGMEQKAAFVADQTPTPTRFIRNCEEVGLFQDLQNVNPFDEGFKRAMEAKHGILSLESALASSSDELHTPQMVFPTIDGDSALYSTTNNQRNITISRSSSDESGAVKEFERTTISKLTNEVTTISRIVGKAEEKIDERNKDNNIRKDSVSYTTNNVIKISNMVRKDSIEKNPVQTLIYEDTVIHDSNILSKDFAEKVPDVPPIMSQKSLDFIVDSLNNDFEDTAKKKTKNESEDYEVIIKLPGGKQVKMRAVEEIEKEREKVSTKEILKKAITEKVESKKTPPKTNAVSLIPVSNVPIVPGTFIPITFVPQIQQKVPITPINVDIKKPVKRKVRFDKSETGKEGTVPTEKSVSNKKNSCPKDLDSRSAASRRYRARLKETWMQQAQENERLREMNEKLTAERDVLKTVILEHLKKCHDSNDLKNVLENLKSTGTTLQ
ncbi:uncharacterized protein LOC118279616 [Spodoptera frugiperda]|uniref:Uncharacterized protein LOC118279616 n=1 Tax=Spodoptera frugiperda TaxID=7108 RepID=A0A9R0E5E9_SPOFR|nr:uncharacterized protein LOC118279616 [Spodoptera frugiperda]XP_050558705.1 uncharacterized protein LOC118279616 [Spodoptera frugiperda]XP_050558706.1 uncharacterized protein LOC118279616 [Spodoptera frugiperda]